MNLLWRKLEAAKHRLFYTLLRLNLPIETRTENPEGLAFDFLADQPAQSGPKVMTGHDNGLITIALAEADDAEREQRRTAMGEPYRTLLGHFRHEVGHYYWDRLVRDEGRLDAMPGGVRRRQPGLRAGAAAALRARRAGELAAELHQRLCDHASVGGLGRDLGALPAHRGHAGDGRLVRRARRSRSSTKMVSWKPASTSTPTRPATSSS